MNILAVVLINASLTLPNPTLTPGAVADTDVRIICAKDYDKTHRPDTQTSHALKLQALYLYNIPRSQIHTVEADALVPVGIGGNHFTINNIWVQRCDTWHGWRCVAGDAAVKDQLEVLARHKTCTLSKIDPNAAQQLLLQYQHQFMTDW